MYPLSFILYEEGEHVASEINICNKAILRLGGTRINALTDQTKEGRLCKDFYEGVRDDVLRAHNWVCATKRIELSLLSEAYVGWDNAYTYPPDCLNARKIYDPNISDTTAEVEAKAAIPYEISLSTTGNKQIILTNQDDAVLIYTAAITDVPLFGADLVEAISLKMAADLALPLKNSEKLHNTWFSRYTIAIAAARAISSNEDNRRDTSTETLLSSRS